LQRADRTDLGVDAVLNCGIVVASPRRPRLYGRRDPCPCADETADRRRARRSAAALVGAATPMAGFRWVSWLPPDPLPRLLRCSPGLAVATPAYSGAHSTGHPGKPVAQRDLVGRLANSRGSRPRIMVGIPRSGWTLSLASRSQGMGPSDRSRNGYHL